jgi:hypothetical protein
MIALIFADARTESLNRTAVSAWVFPLEGLFSSLRPTQLYDRSFKVQGRFWVHQFPKEAQMYSPC